jgi:hypothetical protein
LPARSRLLLFAIQRWSIRVALGVVVLWVGAFVYLSIDARTLPGLEVAGEALPRTRDPASILRPRALAWGSRQVSMITGPHLTVASRAELGATLDADAMALHAASLGHSGNPLVDVWAAVWVTIEGRDLAWSPRVDRIRLGRYVRAIRNLVERPPVAGTTDQEGGAIVGMAGVTLDTVAIAELLERTLRSGGLQIEVGLRDVAAPQAIAIGTPDGIDEHDQHDGEQAGGIHAGASAVLSPEDEDRMRAAAPRDWLPSQGCEPMDPPYEHFCQGPRKVPLPFGAEAALAERLELGSVLTVGHLLNSGPRVEWIAAAGGPTDRRHMLWPVPSGRLWRRFGYVRHPPFEHLLHRGIDVGAPRGTPLYAVNRGIVAYSDNRVRGYGNLLVIVHEDGSVTFSAHCRAIYVFAGQHVQRGQIVGEVGDTGLARGSHVHWEYHLRGQAIDPDGAFGG